MKSEFYNFRNNENCLLFEFQSVSDLRVIEKVIVYSPFEEDSSIYNLALGDILRNGEVSDLTVSNNSDLEKVISTVVQTLFRFFEKYSESSVYFKGSTPQRTRLYRIIISKEIEEAKKIFNIFGIIDTKIEKFELNRPYDSFVLTLKM